MVLTFIDFFAGIGGFRRGLEQAGHVCVGHCEFDKFANTSYQAIHNPKESEWFCNDIRNATTENMPKADVWCFGAPCQDFSIAGQRKGLAGNRSSLVGEIFRLLRELEEKSRPEYILYENVKGMLSSNKGLDFLEILYQMDQLGYDAEWQILNSKNFGVPQNRERVFTVGHLRKKRTAKIFPIERADTGFDAKEIILEGMLDCKGQETVRRVYNPKGIAPTLTTMTGGNRQPKIIVQACLTPDRLNKRQNGRRFKAPDEPMFTLTAQDKHGVKIGDRIRKLTPLECFRLQGWNDEDFRKARKALNDTYHKGQDKSDSQLYKQAGNGVTTTVIYEIARRMQ